MSCAGIGIDLLDVDRLERALERRPRLAERIFTEGERSYAARRARPGRHLAARFCAKEAVAKALALERWSFRDVEVLAGHPSPEVRLSGAAAARALALGATPLVSLSHERSIAAAAAVLSAASSAAGPRAAGTRPWGAPGGKGA